MGGLRAMRPKRRLPQSDPVKNTGLDSASISRYETVSRKIFPGVVKRQSKSTDWTGRHHWTNNRHRNGIDYQIGCIKEPADARPVSLRVFSSVRRELVKWRDAILYYAEFIARNIPYGEITALQGESGAGDLRDLARVSEWIAQDISRRTVFGAEKDAGMQAIEGKAPGMAYP